MFKKLFLPVGVILAVCAALGSPAPAAAIQKSGLIPWLIVTIFLVNGWQMKWKEGRFDASLVKCFLLSVFIALICGPLLGRFTGGLIFNDPILILGLTVISAAPATVSSGIVTAGICGGNNLWALLLTVGLNITCIFTVPIMLPICINGMDGIDINAGRLLWKLFILVFIPFATGALLHHFLKKIQTPAIVGYIPSAAVIITVYAALGESHTKLSSLSPGNLLIIAIASIAVHLIIMLGLAVSGDKLLKLRKAELRSMMLVGAQKSMLLAVSVLAVIGGELGMAAIVAIIFHFLQLILDSLIASYLAGRKLETSPQEADCKAN